MGPKCPKIAMFRPGEIGGFDIPYVHIHVCIFRELNRYVKHIWQVICVEKNMFFYYVMYVKIILS